MPNAILAASLESETELFHSDLRATGVTDRNVPWRGEEHLRAGILLIALRDLDTRPNGSAAQRRKWWRACAWVFGEPEEPWWCNFPDVCEALGINPGYFRRLTLERLGRDEPCVRVMMEPAAVRRAA